MGVVTNPNSKRNRLQPGRPASLATIVGGRGFVRQTRDLMELPTAVGEFFDRGIDYWVADGGDGALHWLINTAWQVLRTRGGTELPFVVPTCGGTINFVAMKVGVRGSAEGILRAMASAIDRGVELPYETLDTMILEGRYGEASEWPGRRFEKVAFAVAAAGVGQRFFDKFYAANRPGTDGILEVLARVVGSLALHAPIVRHLPLPRAARAYSAGVFEPQHLAVWIDGVRVPLDRYRTVNISAMELNLGGVFRLFGNAREPGQLDALVGSADPLQVVMSLPLLALGKPPRGDALQQRPAKTLRIEARPGYAIDPVVDGELFYGLDELDIRIGPPVRVLKIDGRKG